MNKIIWNNDWREAIFAGIEKDWDLLIIGGGITGAGIFRSAVSAGLKVILLEANDFAFGTSSRSSKLVHGGFRYLYNKQFNVTNESVTERERLQREAKYLIEPLSFNIPNYASYDYPSWVFNVGLAIYDLMGRKWDHQKLSIDRMRAAIPKLTAREYLGGFRYKDTVLDDARLVFRVIRESVIDGGTALNYAAVKKLLRNNSGNVIGAAVQDTSKSDGKVYEVRAKAIINATGPWSDDIRKDLNVPDKLRPLRGSHIIIPHTRLPVLEAVTFFHPEDKRAMFVIPWEGTTMIGTTDIDHSGNEFQKTPEPFATQKEINYILQGIDFLFPDSAISASDIISTFAGLRPVINSGAPTPSKESRAHKVWEENGLITISGGKLTTFRIMAKDALEMAGVLIGKHIKIDNKLPMIKPIIIHPGIDINDPIHRRLLGRSGIDTAAILTQSGNDGLSHIDSLPAVWAELKYAVEAESIIHIDDLLLRRTRIGMLLPNGGQDLLPPIKKIVMSALGWTTSKWKKEEKRYLSIWQNYYSPKPGF